MSLRDMVKNFSGKHATATSATFATPASTTVAVVAGVAVANALCGIEQQTARWRWFLSLAKEYGIHPDVIAAEFATEQDQLDVTEPAEHTDEVLMACMKTLCADVRVRQRQECFDRGEWVSVETADSVLTSAAEG